MRAVPLRAINDPDRLRRLMSAMLLLEADLDLSSLLTRLAQEACALVGARYGALGVLNADRSALAEFITVGLDPEDADRIGPRPTGQGILGLLITDPHPVRLADIGAHPGHVGFPAGHPTMHSFLGVPVKVRDTVYGNLYLTEKLDAEEFSKDDEVMVTALAASAGIAIENAQLHRRVQQLAVSDERDRIARDLHDAVIQRLFAVGLSLQGMVRVARSTGLDGRLEKAVGDIDETIRQIRTTIFELTLDHGPGLRSDVLELVRELDAVIGFEVGVTFDGPLDTAVDLEIGQEVRAVVREALTNVARHADATEAGVSIAVADGWCTLTVTDNGRGLSGGGSDASGPAEANSGGLGLSNARRRAEKLGGLCAVDGREGGGTTLTWKVPLHP